jgi:riboflavin kinase
VLQKFQDDFYGEELKVIIIGYIRPEKDFSSEGKIGT